MPGNRFSDKVVLVTGGSSGLGADTCELFLLEGAKVFVTDLEERDILKRLGSENAHFQKCDISSVQDCENAVKVCVEKFGRLDVLFHNGARLAALADVVDHDVETFDSVIKTNLCGLFYIGRAAIPQMRKQGKGVIVNTASTSGLYGDYGLASYNAAKAGIVNLTRTMALDHAREGIRINCVCPGYMVTPMTESFRSEKHVHEALLEAIPMNRGADPKEIGRAVLFLASDDASFITGHALVIDGGMTAASGVGNFPKLFAEAKS
jgi:meso-butanediol dehydrogenase/(S,S)-butanediol dehydrogenase/diacetyl reductase